MSGVIVDRFNLRKGTEMVLLGIHRLIGWIGRGVSNSDAVLDKPSVDSLGWMCHEDPALEVGLGQDVRQRGGVVDVETVEPVSKGVEVDQGC